jgi:ASC-1-like (ASCH) protein|tara:strand:+ start:74 stop:463 length:390 start_codon:yes stop_codon:yes gene_type:complete
MANEYKLEIYRKPLEAIKNGTKRIEIRTNNSYEDIDYKLLQSGDIISFQVINGPPFVNLDVIDPDALKVKVTNVKNYKDPEELLIKEGLEVLSTLVNSLEEGIEMLYSFHEYKDMIPLHGIFAIEIKTI